MIRTKGEGSSDGGEGCMEEKDDDNDDRDEVRGRSVGEGSGDDDVGGEGSIDEEEDDDSRLESRVDLVDFKKLREYNSIRNAAKSIEQARNLDWLMHPLLSWHIARLLCSPTNVRSTFWPEDECEVLQGTDGIKRRVLDAPSCFLDQAGQSDIWLALLQAAFTDFPALQPVNLISKQPDGDARHGETDADHSFLIRCGETVFMLLVGKTEWRWRNAQYKTEGTYSRMSALFLRRKEVMSQFAVIRPRNCTPWVRVGDNTYMREVDGESLLDSDNDSSDDEGHSDSSTDSDEDDEIVSTGDIGVFVVVDGGRHSYPVDAQQPRTLWQKDGSRCWRMMFGSKRPGYFVKNQPVAFVGPDPSNPNLDRILTLMPINRLVRGGMFMLQMEAPHLRKIAEQAISEGSRTFEFRNPTELGRLLLGVFRFCEDILWQANVNVGYSALGKSQKWVIVEGIENKLFLPFSFHFPSGDDDSSGAVLKIKLHLSAEKDVLDAQIKFEYIGEEGPGREYHRCPSWLVNFADVMLGAEGCSNLRDGMAKVLLGDVETIESKTVPSADWLTSGKKGCAWMKHHDIPYHPSDLKSLAPILHVLAASAFPDGPVHPVCDFVRRETFRYPAKIQESGVFEIQDAEGRIVLNVCAHRDLSEKLKPDGGRLRKCGLGPKPTEIALRIFISRGEVLRRGIPVNPPPFVSQDNAIQQILRNFLHEIGLSHSEAPNLIKVFRGAGSLRLEAHAAWKRCFFADRKQELQKKCFDLTRFLCLLSDGGEPTQVSMEYQVSYLGKGFKLREVANKAEWKGIVPGETRTKQIILSLYPDTELGLDLTLKIMVGFDTFDTYDLSRSGYFSEVSNLNILFMLFVL